MRDHGSNKRIGRHRRSGGFTLIEVVLAIMIMGVSLGSLMTSIVRSLEVLTLARHYQEAQWALGKGLSENPLVISNRIDELVINSVELGEDFFFSRDVLNIGDEPEDGLYVVHSRVSRSRRADSHAEEVFEYVFFEE